MHDTYDVIVLGVGSMGSATCFELASRRMKVLGIEQFSIAHDHGSHAGQSRLIRRSYFEGEEYVPLLTRAYDLWDKLESLTNTRLFYRTGISYLGEKEHPMLAGVKNSGRRFGIAVENYSPRDRHKIAPLFEFDEHVHAVFEPDAGFILPEKSILTFCEAAIRMGATICTQTKVNSWEYRDGCFRVTTSKGTFQSKKLVFTSGAWTSELLPDLQKKLSVHQQSLAWFNPIEWDPFLKDNFPCWMYSDQNHEGTFYGFPILPANDFYGPLGLKLAYHAPGKPVRPNEKYPNARKEDVKVILQFVRKHLPLAGSLLSTKTCLYTYSTDEHFYIDHLPGYSDDVAIAAGFSGHGFKFSAVVGEILADLITVGQSDLPIEFLKLAR